VVLCDNDLAESPGPIDVRLNGSNLTRIDVPGHPDLRRNGVNIFDLNLTSLNGSARFPVFNGVDRLQISNGSSDHLCLTHVLLMVNGRTIFANRNLRGWWVGSTWGGQLLWGRSTLRNGGLWRIYRMPAFPTRMPRYELESRIEALVGHALATQYPVLQWDGLEGRDYVEVSRLSDRTFRVTIDLEYTDEPWYCFGGDQPLTAVVDATMSCRDGQLTITPTARVDFRGDGACGWVISAVGAEDLIEDMATTKLQNLLQTLSQNLSSTLPVSSCIVPRVEADGSLSLF
jgi:hypothetical protein